MNSYTARWDSGEQQTGKWKSELRCGVWRAGMAQLDKVKRAAGGKCPVSIGCSPFLTCIFIHLSFSLDLFLRHRRRRIGVALHGQMRVAAATSAVLSSQQRTGVLALIIVLIFVVVQRIVAHDDGTADQAVVGTGVRRRRGAGGQRIAAGRPTAAAAAAGMILLHHHGCTIRRSVSQRRRRQSLRHRVTHSNSD